MTFLEKPDFDRREALRILGYGNNMPDEATARRLDAAFAAVDREARPRWTFKAFELKWQPEPTLEPAALALPGKNIAAHLKSCDGVMLIGLTLGAGVDTLIRAATATNPVEGLMADAAASALIDSYADLAEAQLRTETEAAGRFLTGRFSPGYGDLPLWLQNALVGLIDGPRAIGLTVSDSHIMLPRKSITALLGTAGHPVTGKLAGCDTCALRGGCERFKRGDFCAKLDT